MKRQIAGLILEKNKRNSGNKRRQDTTPSPPPAAAVATDAAFKSPPALGTRQITLLVFAVFTPTLAQEVRMTIKSVTSGVSLTLFTTLLLALVIDSTASESAAHRDRKVKPLRLRDSASLWPPQMVRGNSRHAEDAAHVLIKRLSLLTLPLTPTLTRFEGFLRKRPRHTAPHIAK